MQPMPPYGHSRTCTHRDGGRRMATSALLEVDGQVIEATFAFVDLAGFTALTEAHGDAEAFAIVRAFRDRALKALGPHDELVKTIGDSVMLAFPHPQAAIRAL